MLKFSLKGLEYLQENSMMQKIYKTMKGIKDTTIVKTYGVILR